MVEKQRIDLLANIPKENKVILGRKDIEDKRISRAYFQGFAGKEDYE